MGSVNDFKVLLESLMEQVKSYVGQDHLSYAQVVGDPLTETAEITLQLSDDTWTEQSRAIDKMIELRSMFLGELGIDYHFVRSDADESASLAAPAFSVTVA